MFKSGVFKYLIICLAIILPGSALLAQDSSRFERQRVAVVPSEEGREYSAMLESALGKDKRFDFVDEKDIPNIMKEWERRQSGITESDDTDDLAIKNVHYLVTIKNVQWNVNEERRTVKRNNKNVEIINWRATVTGILKVTRVQEGGTIDSVDLKASSSTDNENKSRQQALKSLKSQVEVKVKKLFPIEAQVYDVGFSSLFLTRGKNTGIESGQRFVLKSQTWQKIHGKSRKVTEKIGLIQVSSVSDDTSKANIIYGTSDFDINKTRAVEEYYTGFAFEIYGSLFKYRTGTAAIDGAEYDAKMGAFDPMLGIRMLGGGSSFQGGIDIGLGFPDNIIHISPGILLRYNFHLARRLFFYLEGSVNLEYLRTDHPLVTTGTLVEDPNIDVKLSNWTIAGMGGAGLKFIVNDWFYVFSSCNYVLAANLSGWSFDEDNEQYATSIQGDEAYDNYINTFSPGGIKIILGAGFYF
ncbi:MAG: hypothetical protein GY754_46410 [bacterium]|nr:hypothetical protein [bacterium]